MPPLLDAIAGRSRLAVVRCLAEAPSSSAPELAQATGLHLNTVRAHLQALEASGVAKRLIQREGRRGRPRVRYRLRRGFVPAGDELLPLSALLAEALAGLDPAAARMREVGVEWGRRWSREMSGQEPERRLRAALERLGFAVEVDSECMCLGSCPCPLVAPENPATLCTLADAVADGVLEGTSLRSADRSHDPVSRRCTTTLAAA